MVSRQSTRDLTPKKASAEVMLNRALLASSSILVPLLPPISVSQSPVADTLFTEMSAGKGLPSKAVTLESMLMTCRFRFCNPVSVVMGAKAASAAG